METVDINNQGSDGMRAMRKCFNEYSLGFNDGPGSVSVSFRFVY